MDACQARDHPSPILRLTDDALTIILEHVVADTPPPMDLRRKSHWSPLSQRIKEDKGRPLAVLISCSQACREWRSLITMSPLLYSAAVDLDIISYRSQEWIAKFMTLTKECSLVVYASARRPPLDNASPHFIFAFLTEHWSRVRKADLLLGGRRSYLLNRLYSVTPLFLNQPALLLEDFRFHFISATERGSNDVDSRVWRRDSMIYLFRGQTPKLKKIECRNLPAYPQTNSTPLLNKLEITLDSAFGEHRGWGLNADGSTFLTTLATASSLESLIICRSIGIDNRVINFSLESDIHLPRLKYLSIQNEAPSVTLEILSRIIPAPGCSLHLVQPRNADSNMELDCQGLKTHATSFFNNHTVSHLELIFRGSFLLFSVTCCCKEHQDNPGTFHIEHGTFTHTITEILSSLSTCALSGITHLSVQGAFHISGQNHTSDQIAVSDTAIEKFFLLLSSVTTLETSIYFLKEYLTRKPSVSVMFPSLRHVQLAASIRGHDSSTHTRNWISHDNPLKFKGPLIRFAAHRRDIGAPLDTLDGSKFWIHKANNACPPARAIEQ